MPDICVAIIDSNPPPAEALPATGGEPATVMWIIAGVLAIALGMLLLRLARRRGAAVIASLAVVLAVAAVVLVPASPASASPGTVTYTGDCTLISIDDVELADSSLAASLVPGDDIVAVTARVGNPTDAPVRITLSPEVEGTLAEAVIAGTAVDGTAGGIADVPPGAHVSVALVLSLPATVGDAVQEYDARTALTITAAQR